MMFQVNGTLEIKNFCVKEGRKKRREREEKKGNERKKMEETIKTNG